MKKFIIILALVLFSVTSLIGLASAVKAKSISDNRYIVRSDETINDTLFVNSNDLTVDGIINGDLYCLSPNLKINGNVNGNVYCISSNVEINGKINGGITISASDIKINGDITKNAMIAANNLSLSDKSKIDQDLFSLVENSRMYGQIGRDFNARANYSVVGGKILRNLKGTFADKIELIPSAFIGGNLEYTSNNELIQPSAAKVSGQIIRNSTANTNKGPSILLILSVLGLMVTSLLLVSITCILLAPKLFENTNGVIKNSPAKTGLVGIVSLIITPIIILTFGSTIVGIPLSFLILAIWASILILSGPVSAYFLGKLITKNKTGIKPISVMAIGSIVILLLYLVPIVNLITGMMVGIFGSGALIDLLLQSRGKLTRSKVKSN